MAMSGWLASYTRIVLGFGRGVVEQARRARRRRTPRSSSVLVATAAFAVALVACGSTPAARTSAQPSTSSAIHTSAQPPSSSPAATARTAVQARPRRSRIDGIVDVAKASYHSETKGAKLLQQLGRIARDGILLDA